MTRKRPCSVCRKWFQPHPRLGARQRTCGSEDCQRERHRRSCKALRDRDREAVREERVRDRLDDGEGGVDRAAMRDTIGPQVAVVLEETLRVLIPGTRDAFRSQLLDITKESVRLLPRPARDTIGGPAP